jgi:hypothetical protein
MQRWRYQSEVAVGLHAQGCCWTVVPCISGGWVLASKRCGVLLKLHGAKLIAMQGLAVERESALMKLEN